jgi:signal transduction histidine kinase
MKTPQCFAAASLLIVFATDLFTPPEFAFDILYLCCILFVFKQNTQTIIAFSAAACMLMLIDMLFIDLKLKLSLFVWVNRAISIFAIFITAYIAIHYRKLQQKGLLKEHQHLIALREMLFINSHKIRKPAANILGLVNILNIDSAILSGPCLKKQFEYLKSSAKELDNFIRELNALIEQTEQENKEPAQLAKNGGRLRSTAKEGHNAGNTPVKWPLWFPVSNLHPPYGGFPN